ncbi:hypothetical protein LEMLEM_LOCUS13297, partial [Lemmus lemmus]
APTIASHTPGAGLAETRAFERNLCLSIRPLKQCMLGRKRSQQEKSLSPKKRFHTAIAYHNTFQDKTEDQ